MNLLQGIKLRQDGSILSVGRHLDDTVVGSLVGEFVDQTTREDTSHLVGEKSLGLLEDTWADKVATIPK